MQRCLGCMRAFGEEFDVCPHCGYIVGTGAASKNYLEPGTVLQNRYTLGKVLGQGGFGITYIAWDNKIGKAVAVKEYMPNAFASRVPGEKSVSCYNTQALAEFRTGLEKTRRETRTLARFNELESVVKVYDCFEENDTAYIVMELLRGKTVKEILAEREQLSFDETMRIMTPVLQTLDSMHSVGMIHRDVAPDNIFVCEDGKIKLLDFGAARVTSTSNEKTLSVILKQGYAPKEQYSGRGNQGAWTDVYAVCATMYRMLTGTTLPDSLSRTEDAAPDVPMPDSAKDALRKGLAVEPEKRTQSAGELLRELQKDLPQSSYAIDPRQFLDFEEKQKKRKRLRILIAAVAATLLLAAVAVAVVTAIRKPTNTKPSETETASLSQTEALPVVTEEELKQKLQKEVGDKEIVDFCYADYNSDGQFEAFALTGIDTSKSEDFFGPTIRMDICFVTNEGVEFIPVHAPSNIVSARIVNLTNNMRFLGYAVNFLWGNGDTYYFYSVDPEGRPKNLHFSSGSLPIHSSNGWFWGTCKTYDDAGGRIEKEYFFYFDESLCEVVQYGAMEISMKQFLCLDDADTAIKDIPKNNIVSILYRENDVIDINYLKSDSDENSNRYYRRLYVSNGAVGGYYNSDEYGEQQRLRFDWFEENDIYGFAADYEPLFNVKIRYPTDYPYDDSLNETTLESFIETYKKEYDGRHVNWWDIRKRELDIRPSFRTEYIDIDADGQKECFLMEGEKRTPSEEFLNEGFLFDQSRYQSLQLFDCKDGVVWLLNEWKLHDEADMVQLRQHTDGTYLINETVYGPVLRRYEWTNGKWILSQYIGEAFKNEYYALDTAMSELTDWSWEDDDASMSISKSDYEKRKKELESEGNVVLIFRGEKK